MIMKTGIYYDPRWIDWYSQRNRHAGSDCCTCRFWHDNQDFLLYFSSDDFLYHIRIFFSYWWLEYFFQKENKRILENSENSEGQALCRNCELVSGILNKISIFIVIFRPCLWKHIKHLEIKMHFLYIVLTNIIVNTIIYL